MWPCRDLECISFGIQNRRLKGLLSLKAGLYRRYSVYRVLLAKQAIINYLPYLTVLENHICSARHGGRMVD